MAIICPICQKKYTTQAFMEAHADEAHPDWRIPKSRGWRTPYGFGDWNEAITYDEACKRMKSIFETLSIRLTN